MVDPVIAFRRQRLIHGHVNLLLSHMMTLGLKQNHVTNAKEHDGHNRIERRSL